MSDIVSFDYVIVGAGSAGCVLANRLSQDHANRVLVLEAGPMDHNLLIHVPAGVYSVFRDPSINWNYMTETEPELNRTIGIPRGKVVGGSSSINSMVYMRGLPQDYDAWEADFGLPGWAYRNCLPYFRAAEASDRGSNPWHGDSGRLGVRQASLVNPLYDALLEAGETSGQGRSEDLNGYHPEGLARLDSTKKDGRRCSAAVAHLRPALARDNLVLITRAEVQELIHDGNRIAGLTFRHRGTIKRIEAAEVILAGGAINSPLLLMQSGIGPADHLREIGISVRHDLPGVGNNLMDHPAIVVKQACTKPVTLDRLANPVAKGMAGARWLLDQGGIASSNIWEAGGLIRGDAVVDRPNLQYHFGPFGVRYEGKDIKLEQAMSLQIDQLRPTSRGAVTLDPSNPRKPRLQYNFLSTDHDRREIVDAVKRAREVLAQPSFNEFRGHEMFPGPDARTDAEILAAIRTELETDYHPCGTCRMGHDADAVVDGELRVHGLPGLRVVDASVMPRVLSANLNAPTQMIAARAADFILGHPQLEPEDAPFSFQARP